MLSAKNPSFVFSEHDSYALAHWAALKIVVAANALGHERSALDPGVYYDLKRGAIPHGFFVEVGTARSPDVNSSFGPVTIWQAREPDRGFAGELAAHSYIGCYQVGGLVFRASFVPSHPRVTRVRLVHETTLLHPYGRRMPFEAHDRGVGVDLNEFLSFGISLGICVDYHLTRFGRQWFEVDVRQRA